ncbi:NleF caspase inhibitor [Burkholderia ubonensis]|uniref:NleF caspase inhibitor n=1 Tax=Burkholderia ubonensis TaxID=101571 RepID=UPI0009B43E83|nr:NleF caspase inhibitor [Burkholderia ubonensis]
MPSLSAIGHAYSAQARNENIDTDRTQAAITVEKSSLKITDLEIPINSNVNYLVNEYMDRLGTCRAKNTHEEQIQFEAVKNDADRARHKLLLLRDDTFEYVGANTNSVYGQLKAGKTEADRDRYIEELVEYYQIKTNFEKEEQSLGFAKSELFEIPTYSYLHGDIEALTHKQPVPNFYWLAEEDQVG